jgi:sec-independent protein translocase protein TatA
MQLAAIGGLGPWELVIILAIVLVVFGAGKLPQIGGSIGQAIKNFKKGVKDGEPEVKPEMKPDMKKDKK